MKTAQKNGDGYSARFSYTYSSPSGGGRQRLGMFFARALWAVFIAALTFTACENFMEGALGGQTGKPVPLYRTGNQNILTIVPSSAQVARGSVATFQARMGGYAAGANWAFESEVSEGTKITNGRLTVAAGESATTLNLIATLNANSSYKARARVFVE
jgi:hypothetical protein